ncbi:MAG: hypothetical protein ACI898_000586 [Flavobacteriales bacterium]|jgi:hypothetical protein
MSDKNIGSALTTTEDRCDQIALCKHLYTRLKKRIFNESPLPC